MKGLREKFRKNEGFTLVEMLIVVAIIAILIAVSLPMFAANLNKARHAVDQANIRSAIGLANAAVLSDNITTTTTWDYVVDDADDTASRQGKLVTPSNGGGVEGQCSDCDGNLVVTYTYDSTGGTFSAEFSSTP